MNRESLIVIAGATLGAAYMLVTWANAQADLMAESDASEPDASNSLIEDLMSTARNTLGLWRPPAKYAAMISAAESQYGLPRDMLARLLYQESRYREDIISGRTRSPAGALGIAQFMPPTAAEMGIDPLNVPQSIDAAARYLARLFRMFGNWSEALAAYNWGMGNVQRKGLANAPAETRNYYRQILADVNAANGTAYA